MQFKYCRITISHCCINLIIEIQIEIQNKFILLKLPPTEVMSGDHDTDLVRIPSVFIGEEDGLAIQSHFQFNQS